MKIAKSARRLMGCSIWGAGVLWATSLCGQIDVDHVISIGRNALYFNDYVVSIGYFNRAVDARPWLAEPYYYRSIAKISLEDYKGAEQDAALALERNPFISKAYLVRGISRQNLQDYTGAIEDYSKGLALVADSEDMRYNLAVAQMMLGQYDEAEQSVGELKRYVPKSKRGEELLANIALERGDTTLALRRIEEALRIDSLKGMPYKLKAQITLAQGNYDDALVALNKAIELEGDRAELYTNRAILYYRRNNLRGAMADYTTALSLEGKNKIALNNRALLRMQVGEYNGALEDWNKLVGLEPENYIARFNRAYLNEKLGDLKASVEDLNVVLVAYPSFIEGYWLRSQLYNRLGDKKRANQDYWRAVDLGRDTRLSQQALAQAKKNKAERQTRDEGDSSIDNYALLVEENSIPKPDKLRYGSKVRGRIQEQDVRVETRPMFVLSYFDALPSEERPTARTYYSSLLDGLNQRLTFGRRLVLLSGERPLKSEEIEWLQTLASREQGVSSRTDYFVQRGVAHALLQDYDQAIADYTEAIGADDANALAYFARATASARRGEVHADRLRDGGGYSLEDLGRSGSEALRDGYLSPPKALLLPSGQAETLSDLNKVIELDPHFAYAYYNRALLLSEKGDIEPAIKDYTKAIELSDRIPEAYFNRGLLYLRGQRVSESIADLSRAGELGIFEAYNIIKRIQ